MRDIDDSFKRRNTAPGARRRLSDSEAQHSTNEGSQQDQSAQAQEQEAPINVITGGNDISSVIVGLTAIRYLLDTAIQVVQRRPTDVA